MKMYRIEFYVDYYKFAYTPILILKYVHTVCLQFSFEAFTVLVVRLVLMSVCDCISEFPVKCRRSKDGVDEVICHQRNLVSVPAFFPLATKSVDLSYNNIGYIIDEDFRGCSHLEILDLTWNKIASVQTTAFESLVNLKSLKMIHSLKYPFNVSFDGLFTSLAKLEDINIQYNFFGANVPFPVSQFSNILSHFPDSLKSLHIDIPEVSSFASFLVNFTRLINLGINAKDSYKFFITNDTFRPLKNLPIRNLTLRSNRLMKVDTMAFSWFEKLEYLDMSNSSGIVVDDLSDAWHGMKNVPIKSIILNNFGNKNNFNVKLSRFFENFKFDNLTELALDKAGISGASHWKFSESARNLRNYR